MKLLSCPTLYFENSVITDPEQHHTAADILQGFLGDAQNTKCRWNIAISGSLLRWLAEKRAKSLMSHLVTLHRDGQFEILLTPAFQPSPVLGEEAVARHLDFARSIWQELGVEGEMGIFLPDSVTYPGKYRPGIEASIKRNPRTVLLEGDALIGQAFDTQALGMKFRCARTAAQEIDLTEEKLRRLLVRQQSEVQSSFALFLPTFRPLKKLSKGLDERMIIAALKNLSRLFSGTTGASVTARSLSSVAAEPHSIDSFVSPKPFDSPSTTPVAFRRLFPLQVRLSDATQLKKSPSPAEVVRLMDAATFLLQAESEEFFTPAFLSRPELRSAFNQLVISADVELDYLLNPKVDPTIGWVRLAKHEGAAGGTDEFTIDTQLAKFSLHPSGAGALTALEFKPAKWNVLSTMDPATLLPLGSFVDSVVALTEQERTSGTIPRLFGRELPTRKARPTKHSRDLLTLRVEGPLSDRFPQGVAIKDFSFKAGIGAHLPNATTGLTLEYWIESETQFAADDYHVVEVNLIFPSLHPGSIAAKALMCVGGVSPEQHSLDVERRFPTNSVEGGLFGVRLIDGISGFAMDLRSSKQLSLMHISPLGTAQTSKAPSSSFQGIALRIALPASRIVSDGKSNTLFVSIV